MRGGSEILLAARPARLRDDAIGALAGIVSIAGVVAIYSHWIRGANVTTVALSFLLIVLIVAATSRLWVALTTSVVAVFSFNFFFLPPFGTLTIADPQNWVALVTFLAVSIVASRLSSVARARTEEALARRDELARLFELSCDVLLMTDGGDALPALARLVAKRFHLAYAAICLRQGDVWRPSEAGSLLLALDQAALSRVFSEMESGAAEDGAARPSPGYWTTESGGHLVRLVPIRFGARVIGLLAVAGRPFESGTLDALAGVVAIAMERAQFLEERKAAEVSRQSEELKSALLASLAHDLRTPLTAIRVGAANLQGGWLTPEDRTEQGALVIAEVDRLTRLLSNILEMARIEAGAIGSELRWVHPSEIVEGARDQVAHALVEHPLTIDATSDRLVRVDPRLTAAALGHLLENAAQYAPSSTPILVAASVSVEGLVLTVRDQGPGIAPRDLPHLFDRFYRGAGAKSRPVGTGMGLAIAKGLLAVEHGRIFAENCPDGGARLTIVVPAETKASVLGEGMAAEDGSHVAPLGSA